MKKLFLIPVLMAMSVLLLSCGGGNQSDKNDSDTLAVPDSDSLRADTLTVSDTVAPQSQDGKSAAPQPDLPKVLVYNFHVTNRCASCNAIESATTKTLNTYFSDEVKQGRIKRYVLNVDDAANKKISEKYEAFGSGLFVTRVYKGSEKTTDLTGEGFKYARNKEEKFIEILKSTIAAYLK